MVNALRTLELENDIENSLPADEVARRRSNALVLGTRPPPTDVSWWAGTVGFNFESTAVYHELTRLGQHREGLLVVPGAFDNLVGENWVRRMETIIGDYKLSVSQKRMERVLGIEGVGKEAQTAVDQVTVPGAIRERSGKLSAASFSAPVLPGSDVPALLGLRIRFV